MKRTVNGRMGCVYRAFTLDVTTFVELVGKWTLNVVIEVEVMSAPVVAKRFRSMQSTRRLLPYTVRRLPLANIVSYDVVQCSSTVILWRMYPTHTCTMMIYSSTLTWSCSLRTDPRLRHAVQDYLMRRRTNVTCLRYHVLPDPAAPAASRGKPVLRVASCKVTSAGERRQAMRPHVSQSHAAHMKSHSP